MCGLTGFLSPPAPVQGLTEALSAMARTLVHRGPDDSGVWIDAEAGVALGHRRLSILDLSPLGHQPMRSSSGRYVLAYNGEIYNFPALRAALLGHGFTFRGHSDTEVALAAFEQWGVEAALQRFVGMFAMALWDREERVLTLARDRFGEKPLYYGFSGGHVLFGSELKALTAHPAWDRPLRLEALAAYLRFNYVPDPHSIYQDTFKVPPGCLLRLHTQRLHERPLPTPYWTLRESAATMPAPTSDIEAQRQLEALLEQAIEGQMLSDVPLGAFLSGGVDSSTVVALMQRLSSQPIKTFTIGLADERRNEAPFARAVAAHLKTDHSERIVHPDDALAVVPLLPHLYDEPFADSSQIPTYLVSQLAREHVTVALSGDGGDELFGGYPRYELAPRYARRTRGIPRLAGHLLARTAERLADTGALPMRLGDLASRTGEALAMGGLPGFHRALMSGWTSPARLLGGSREAPSAFDQKDVFAGLDAATAMMHADTLSYLPGDLLVKVDRAAMGVSLEARVPLLDHRVAAFAFALPLSFKRRAGQSKWLLRQVLYRFVPPDLIERPKAGFGIPIAEWLRGPLRAWANELLRTDRLSEEGLLTPQPVQRMWQAHQQGKGDYSYALWTVLMLQLWRETNAPRLP